MKTAVRNSRKTSKNQTLKEYAQEIGLGCLQERIEILRMIRRDMIEKNCSLQNIAWEHHDKKEKQSKKNRQNKGETKEENDDIIFESMLRKNIQYDLFLIDELAKVITGMTEEYLDALDRSRRLVNVEHLSLS